MLLRCITPPVTFKILSDRISQLMMDTDNVFLQNQGSVLYSLEDLAQQPRLRGTPTWLHHFLIELWIRMGKLEISQCIVFVTVESPEEQWLAGGTLLKGTHSLLKSIVSIGPLVFPCGPCKGKVTFFRGCIPAHCWHMCKTLISSVMSAWCHTERVHGDGARKSEFWAQL